MPAKKEVESGIRYAAGFVCLSLFLFLGLGLASYDWQDIGFLVSPPHNPPTNLIGPIGAWTSFALLMSFGFAAYFVPGWLLVLGLLALFNREPRFWTRVLWALLAVLCSAGLMALHVYPNAPLCTRLNLDVPGGLLCEKLVRDGLLYWMHPVGTALLLWPLFLLAVLMFIRFHNLARSAHWLTEQAAAAGRFISTQIDRFRDERSRIAHEQRALERQERKLQRQLQRQAERDAREARRQAEREAREARAEARRRRHDEQAAPTPEPEVPALVSATPPAPVAPPVPAAPPPRPAPPPPPRAPAVTPPAEDTDDAVAGATDYNDYVLPAIDLLARPAPHHGTASGSDTAGISRLLVDTLAEFGIEAQVTDVQVGPVVTRYELLPAAGVKVERISNLSANLALSLKATSLRVQAPVPGKGVVGIEVPNSTAKTVLLREILEGPVWQSGKARVPLALGKDVAGKDLVGDLASMPHLLIAGATGAGKTVCMNSILAGLLMSRTPAELRLLLVDPKIVEFAVYNQLPHLVAPVITDPKKVALGLRWAINEMEKRYKLFAKVGVRNIEGFNSRPIARQADLFASDEPAAAKPDIPARLPYIVIIIDELADIMLANQADIENHIARLAQLSRAVGIHMILATQRPSVNVITGTIKANFPARIAFQTAQRNDSRTILDAQGAEQLLGRGDMLFMPPGAGKLIRAQGALTTDEEIRTLVEFIKRQGEPEYDMGLKTQFEKPAPAAGAVDDGQEDDAILAQAIEIIREARRASTSSLQRRMRIGYTRAARIMDILEERGIVGPARGAEPREILIDLDGEIPNNPTVDDGADAVAEDTR